MGRIVIIGAGLAGLSTACHLSRTGHQVTVVEAAPRIGGLSGELRTDGFTFDTGPTVLTMPEIIDATLRSAGSQVGRLDLQRIDPGYRAHFWDGSQVDVWADPERMTQEIAEVAPAGDVDAYRAHVAWLRRLTDLELPHFIDRNFDSPLDLLRTPRALLQLIRMRGFGNLQARVDATFADPRLRRVFSFQTLYAGLAPADTLALYGVISYMDCVRGVFFPRGGMHALPTELASAAQSQGVSIRTGERVTALSRDGHGRVSGVIAADRSIPADAVVCTVDPQVAWSTFAGGAAHRRPQALRYSPSAVVWHLGVRGEPTPAARHHNIHFGHAWDASFDDLVRHGRLMRDPSRLVTVPSLTDPSRAPLGHSAMYVLEPVPNLLAGTIDWARRHEQMRHRLSSFLAESGYPAQVVASHLVTPREWEQAGLPAGTPFSASHRFTQTGPFRTRNRSARRPGLFYAGAGTTPGVGVPMVLLSGGLAAQRVQTYLRREQQ